MQINVGILKAQIDVWSKNSLLYCYNLVNEIFRWRTYGIRLYYFSNFIDKAQPYCYILKEEGRKRNQEIFRAFGGRFCRLLILNLKHIWTYTKSGKNKTKVK